MTTKTLSELTNIHSVCDDYDPNSMPVDKARALIAQFLTPLTVTERVHVRSALNRILAEDVISPINVPSNDNSAMDGYGGRAAGLPQGVDVQVVGPGEGRDAAGGA